MTIKSSYLFAKSLIFPKNNRKSSARKSLWGALICIGLSLVPLVVVISVTDGMIEGMTERLIGLSSGHLEAYVAESKKELKSAEGFRSYAQEFEDVEGVTEVYPEINISALAAGKNYRTGAQIRAVNKNVFTENKDFASLITFVEGTPADFENDDGSNGKTAVVGQKIAELLDLHKGDRFRIITTKKSGEKILPKLSSFTVSGIVTSGYQELDALWVFISLEDAYASLSLNNANYNLLINTENAFSPSLSSVQRNVRNKADRWANVYRWNQIHASEFENFSSTKVMLVFIMMMIVLVASINISSAIIMLVMERKKEIAILKSIGGTSKGITLSFLLTGAACGTGGVLIGIPVGVLISVFINQLIKIAENIMNFFAGFFTDSHIVLLDPSYYLTQIPVTISIPSVILTALGTIILSVIVSIIPSVKAGKEKPLEIIRKN